MQSHNLIEETINKFIPVVEKTIFGTNIDEKFKLTLAIGLFVNNVITLERAAELSGKSLNTFIEILSSNRINWAEYNNEHYQQDTIALKKYKELRSK